MNKAEEKFQGFVVLKLNTIHSANWSKTNKYKTFFNLLSYGAPKIPFKGIFYYIKHFPIVRWRFQKCPLSVLERFPSNIVVR